MNHHETATTGVSRDICTTGGEACRLSLDALEYPKGLFVPGLVLGGESEPFLLVPPIVASLDKGRWCIIDGCKRVSVLGERGCSEVLCVVVPSVRDERERGMLRLRLNHSRTLHLKEKLIFLRWLEERRGTQPLERVTAEAGISPAECRRLAPLLSAPDTLVDAVVEGRLDQGCVAEVARWTDADRQAFADMLWGLECSQQTQRELAEWLSEWAAGESRTVAELIKEVGVALGESGGMNAPQRIAKIHDMVFARRFPRYFAARERWRKEARSANPAPGAVHFLGEPFYEKDRLEIRVRVGSAREAVELFGGLAAVPMERWAALVNPAAGDCG